MIYLFIKIWKAKMIKIMSGLWKKFNLLAEVWIAGNDSFGI